jgi:hypothetical protein
MSNAYSIQFVYRIFSEIGKLRKRIKGVNAVQENDIAVAHCSSIMQHRLMKAEEEYMKLIKAQQEVRKDVDTVRRELLSLRKVKKKLDMDIQDVTQVNEAIEDKIKSSKMIRTLLAEELSDLERKAEITQEERKLKLCPEEEVIVDVEKLMHAVSERNDSRMERHASMQAASVAAATSATAATSIASSESSISSEEKNSFHKNLYQGLNYTNAFRVIQNTLGFEEDIEKFIDHFISTEEQLLSKHKVIVYLQEEENELQKQLNQIVKESTKKNEHVRGSYQENMIIQTEIQTKMNLTFSRIESYQELKELRNQEHIRLRNIMQKCLDIVRAEKNLARKDSSSFVLNGSFSVATVKEVSSAVMLEMLQEKITEIAFQLKKFQHRHDRNRSSSSSSSKSMTLMNFVNTIEDTSATTNGNGTADGSEEILSTEAKRSNAFSVSKVFFFFLMFL